MASYCFVSGTPTNSTVNGGASVNIAPFSYVANSGATYRSGTIHITTGGDYRIVFSINTKPPSGSPDSVVAEWAIAVNNGPLTGGTFYQTIDPGNDAQIIGEMAYTLSAGDRVSIQNITSSPQVISNIGGGSAIMFGVQQLNPS